MLASRPLFKEIPDILIRAEYAKLGLDLPRLAGDFSFPMDERDALHAYLLAVAMDRMDRALDDEFDDEVRTQIALTIVAAPRQGDLMRN